MNFKKTLAAVAASALAVSAMATAAFADGVYGGTWDELATELGTAEFVDATADTDAEGWKDIIIADKSALKEVGKDKAIIVYVSDVNDNAYFKCAGNDASGNWKESAKINGNITKLEAYDAEAGTITVPYSEWGVYASFAIQGGKGCNFWGIAFEDDADTIAAIEALIAADSAAEDTEAPAEDTEAPAEDTEAPADEETGAGDTAEEGASKGNSDTGVEGVAAIAGLAIVAAGAVIVAKKRG